MAKFKPYNVNAITNNFKRVLNNKDIELLDRKTYQFIILYCGFIAHYNLFGFRDTYSSPEEFYDFVERISQVFDTHRYITDQFFINSYGLDYCRSQVETLENLKECASNFINGHKLEKYKISVPINQYFIN